MASQKFRTITGLETQEIDMISPDKSDTISVSMSDTDSVIFSGDTGQLMSVTDATSGIIYSVNDVSGIPSFEVHDDGTVIIAEGIGNVLIGTDVDSGEKLQVNGSIGASDIKVTPYTKLTTTFGTLATNAKTAFHDILLSFGGDLTIVGFDNVTGYTQTSKISYSIAGNGNVVYDEYSRIYTYMGALGNFSVEYSGMGNSILYITQFSTNSTSWVVYDNGLLAQP